ncbi:tRNA glutamyl-Q(34) synthetase GluQRS [Sediminivirga luteola]|jgi:glutamyl-tRNA synthetase|uniref:tRNA glutamyl-Q(34) synthetase GluQRS n=1 Tax=Sediminivirga luteola TaxID=1774748 RepID=UPI001F587696|nr:tRNA glutamyl-Q(34) synthetase GluQRS [Sediminivirga luteola]MCI2263957.1 tRNA glutamyl-Q(34) synthetase GluQRS [Sediminivirga luteola]
MPTTALAQVRPGHGRYAPSPSGDLHLGNARTALLAWAYARLDGLGFLLRIEDLDRVQPGAAERQCEDLRLLGLDWDEPPVRQSQRTAHYEAALGRLREDGLVYECYCSRRDIQDSPRAPHLPPGAYPGTCRDLDEHQRAAGRERLAASGRKPALRLRGEGASTIHDRFHGELTLPVDDVVLRRGDGVIAYNLAVVVDDGLQHVTQVVRADDLLSSAPRQAALARLLGYAVPEYVHVPLVLSEDGRRYAKRDGDLTVRALLAAGCPPEEIVGALAASIGVPGARTADEVLGRLDPAARLEVWRPHTGDSPLTSRV